MSAFFSSDGLHRYSLGRELPWPPRSFDIVPGAWPVEVPVHVNGPRLLVLGVNPSKAGVDEDDPTIRKVKGFATRMGARYVTMGNKFTRIATDVRELKRWDMERAGAAKVDDEYLDLMLSDCDLAVAAWGPLAKLPDHLRRRWRTVHRIAEARGRRLYCWGTARDGHPRHPLMLAYVTPCVPWVPPV